MDRRRLFAIIGLVITASWLRADVPHVELLDGLRRDGMADLALEYLDLLEKQPPAGLRERIPLERAKALIDLAELQEDEKKRDDALNRARRAFTDFLKVNQDAAIGADARLDLARLIVRQGKNRISAARRSDSKAERQTGMAQARAILEQAEKELATASAAFKAERDKPNADRERLARRVTELDFEAAVLKLNKALTYSDQNAEELKKRTADMDAVRRQFQRIADADPNDPLAWQAFAWVGRCYVELDNRVEAKKTFDAIEKDANKPGAAEAARTVRLYQLQLLDNDPNVRSRVNDVQRGCEDWLSRHSRFAKSPEGLGVQFLLATNLIAQAQAGIKPATATAPASVGPTARLQLERAEKLLKVLSQSDSDYTRKATNLRAEVLLLLTAERTAAGIDRLNSFEECYLTAQVEAHQMSKVKDGPNAEAERSRCLKRSIQALQRGLSLAGKADAAKDVFDARLMLSYLFLLNGDPYSSAVLGEHLTRTAGRSPRGAKAAVYALNAYATILGESRARNVAAEEIAADKARIRTLANDMEKQWPNEPETDQARFQLGELYFDDSDYPAAAEMYHRIKESFPAYAYARYRQGAAAQLANAKDFNSPDDRKKLVLDQAIADLATVGYPPPGSASDTVLAHCEAKLQLGSLYQVAGKIPANYDNVAKIGHELKAKLPELVKKDDPFTAQLETAAERLIIAGTTGKAYLQVKADKFDDARKTIAPLIETIDKSLDAWKKSPNADKEWFQQYLKTQRDVLLLSLRADLAEGKSDAVKPMLERVKTLTPSDKPAEAYDVLLRLVYELKSELEKFQQAKDTDRQRKLQEGLVSFLDELASGKDLSTDICLFLAQGYAAVDRHEKAAALLTSIQPPKADADEESQRTYRFVRLTLAKEHRLAKEYGPAKNVLREIMGTQTQKAWGFDNFEVRKEAIALLDDEGAFGPAVQMALAQQKRVEDSARQYVAKSARVKQLQGERESFKKKADNETQINKVTEEIDKLEQDLQQLGPARERYYEFYFLEIQSVVKSAVKTNDAKAQDTLNRTAIRMVKLEQGQPDFGGDANRARFKELIDANAPLKEKYVANGGKLLLETKP